MTRDEVAAALADMFTSEGVSAIGVDLAMDLADPLWRVAEAARKVLPEVIDAELPSVITSADRRDDIDRLMAIGDRWAALRAALTALDAKVEGTK